MLADVAASLRLTFAGNHPAESALNEALRLAMMASSRILVLLQLLFIFVSKWMEQVICNEQEPGGYSVIIVGAGMSGIMAAKTLSDNAVKNFVILEATDKIGGRMRTQHFASQNIELGANWVEGVNGPNVNPIWQLAQESKLRTCPAVLSNISSNIYSENGLLPASVVNETYRTSLAAWQFANDLGLSKKINNKQDISILTAERLFGHVPSSPVEMALEYFHYDTEFAEPPRATSLKNTQPTPTFLEFGDDMYMVADPRGYSHIVHQLAKTFLAHKDDGLCDPRLQLNKVVRRISYSDDGVTILTEDGSLYTANYTIVTVSLGVLQSKLIEFHPDLPDWKIEALYQFDMGIYTKLFLKFPYRFWPNEPGTEYFLYADERRGYYPHWQHLENEYPGSNIIFAKVTDDESRRVEQQSDNHTKAEMMVVLRKMFGESIPEPDDILVPRWWSNRFFRGTYSNWPIGVDDYEFEQIQAPIIPLYFSGEHTSLKYNGYVHGTYYSGIETANLLLECIKAGNCSTEVPKPRPCNRLRKSIS